MVRGQENTQRIFGGSHRRTFGWAHGIRTRTRVTPGRILSPCRLHFAHAALGVAVCLNTRGGLMLSRIGHVEPRDDHAANAQAEDGRYHSLARSPIPNTAATPCAVRLRVLSSPTVGSL